MAKVTLFGNTAGGFGIEGLEDKVVLGETSEAAPALASHNGRLFLGWKGSGNDALNLAFSDDGVSFGGKRPSSTPAATGRRSPPTAAVCSSRGRARATRTSTSRR